MCYKINVYTWYRYKRILLIFNEFFFFVCVCVKRKRAQRFLSILLSMQIARDQMTPLTTFILRIYSDVRLYAVIL